LSVLLVSLHLSAQFNDSIHNHIAFSGTGNYNRTSEGSSAISNNSLEFRHQSGQISSNTVLKYIYGEQNHAVSNSDLYALQEVNRYFSKRRFYLWLLGSYAKIYSLDVKHQFQSGAGLAYNVLNDKHVFLNLSDGLLYEYSEHAGQELKPVADHTVRNSLRVQLKIKFNGRVSMFSTFFLQNSLKNVGDMIIREESELNVKLHKKLTSVLKLQYNRMTSTGKETFLVTWGLMLDTYF
jgi:hypothetical protein